MAIASLKKAQKPENEPPNYLEPATAEWFRSVVADYDLQPHHIRLLTAACECWDRMQAARAAIAKKGLTMADSRTGAERARPEVSIERDSKIVILKLLRELNLSESVPDSRPPKLRYGGIG